MPGLTFPPLMSGEAVADTALARAVVRARDGVDAGLITYCATDAVAEAALVLAPEVPLAQAMVMLPLCCVGFQNALGALAPPEVAVHLGWDGRLYLNGAEFGRMRVAAPTHDPDAVPDWLVIGYQIALWPDDEDTGQTPDQTTLYAEGCISVTPDDLVQAWARHTMLWIGQWEDGGAAVLHREWQGLVHGLNTQVTQNGLTGTFLGTDEGFSLLLRDAQTTHAIPLTTLLETVP